MPTDPPGTVRPPALAARLEAAAAARGTGHAPRTRHLGEDGAPRHVNRLILEASPYLLQHAHNPVDWRPWGEEALAEAARRGVPVFLSAGYATCHWCHVMEEESFDDEQVAERLNAGFVPVKLDREERPDIDRVYIVATELQHGHAGWPVSAFLKPDGTPFHTATYLPREQFLALLDAVSRAWREQPDEIESVAARLGEAIRREGRLAEAPAEPPGEKTAAAAARRLSEMHDPEHGGFSAAQRFPQESFLLFLLDRWRRDGDTDALAIVRRTLDAIAAGGIHDHVGGGFHRYATDPDWRTPHFEKMLYNQGQLARAFVEGWEALGAPAWRRAAERCFAYVLRDMTDPEGAFFAAEDADSPGADGRPEEGAFYAWPRGAVEAALGAEAGWAIETLGLDARPRIEAGPVPHLAPGAEVDFDRLDPLLEQLREAREARPRPVRDGKVIAGWNGLMIRALAEAALAFGAPAHARAAARAGEAVWRRLWDGERLARLWAGGAPHEAGLLEDHAWLGLGFLALDEATGEPSWRARAHALARAAARGFSDPSGRLRMAAEDGPLGPVFESSDGATPAGESAALELLLRAGEATGDADLALRARELLAAIAGPMRELPILRPEALAAARLAADGSSGYRRLLAQGALLLQLARREGGWRLEARLAEGSHLTADEPGVEGLEGAAANGARVDWPEGAARPLAVAGGSPRVYEGALSAPLAPEAGSVRLRLQVCSDKACLAPAEPVFRIHRPETAP
jgi:hypothetical protein